MTSVDLRTTVAGMSLPSPVMTAAGCAGSGRELEPFLDVASLGAVVTRSVTLDGGPGAPMPRLVETPGGILAAAGLPGPGIDGFLASELVWLVQHQARAVVSIAARTLGEFAELARRVGNSPGVHAIEVNLSWPTQPPERPPEDPYQAAKVLAVVRREVPQGIAVLAKLPPHLKGLVDLARAVADAGADGVVLVNGLPGMALDPDSLRPRLGAGVGTLGGPALHALAVRCVWEVHAALPGLPVVGVGGVRSGYDALELMLAGAGAVQVGTTTVFEPGAPARVTAELRDELSRRGFTKVADAVGRAQQEDEVQP